MADFEGGQGARAKAYLEVRRAQSDADMPEICPIPKGCGCFRARPRCSSFADHARYAFVVASCLARKLLAPRLGATFEMGSSIVMDMELFYLALLTLLGSFVGTLTGFGTSTVMVPLALFLLPLPETLLLVGVIHWFGNIWKIMFFRVGFRLRLALLFGIPSVIAAFAGAQFIFSVPEAALMKAFGAFFLVYALSIIIRPAFKIRAGNATAIVGGTVSGLLAGIFGVGGATRAVFLSAFNLPKEVFLATAGAVGILADSARIIGYFSGGASLPRPLVLGLILFIPISFLGAGIAKLVVRKIPEEKFRIVIAVFLLLAGARFLFW